MCTIGRTAGGTAGKAHHRTDRAQYPVWNGQERKDNGAKRCRSSFLNTTFLPRPLPSLFVEDTGGNRYNLIEGVSKCTPSVFYAQSPDFHKLGLCYYLKILYL